MICRMCLNNSENYFSFFGDEGLAANVATIVGKHFWFEPKPEDEMSSFICQSCWILLKEFHEFYVLVEAVHFSHFNLSIKSDPKEEVPEDEYDQKEDSSDQKDDCSDNMEWNTENFDNIKNDVDLVAEPIEVKISVVNTVENETPCITKKKRGRPTIKTGTQLLKFRKKIKPATDQVDAVKEKKLKRNIDEKSDSKLYEEDKMIADFMKIICSICSVEKNTFSSLKRHFSSEHKEDGFVVCCDQKYFKRNSLVDHIGKHINPDSLRCNFCNKPCKSRRTLKSHIEKIHEDNTSERQQCAICNKSFKNKKILLRHHLTHVPEEEKKFKCIPCEKSYATQSVLDQHVRFIHDKRYAGMCDICGKTYNNKQDVKRHRMMVHEGAEKAKIQCNRCPLEFPTKYQYNIHKDEVHSGPNRKTEHKCEDCNKTYGNSESLKRHIDQVHKRKPRFPCNICYKLFKTELTLKEHMATHTGEPLYVCPHCPKTFTHNANMHHHRKQAHPAEFEAARLWKGEKKQSWTQMTAITN